GAHDAATPEAGGRQGVADGIGNREQPVCGTLGCDAGVVEFMAAQRLRPWRAGERCDGPITEMQLASSEAGGERQQAGHGVSLTVSVDQGLTQHHEAAALAVEEAWRVAKAVEKPGVGGELSGMKLRIAARQECGICCRVWRL